MGTRTKQQAHSSPSDLPLIRGGFIQNQRFAMPYQYARQRTSTKTQKKLDPYESETTALFEDLYNHIFFPDECYSNNSQQPPIISSLKACDIVTRYWTPAGRRCTLLFSEAKRDSTPETQPAEKQLLQYCQEHLSARDSNSLVFGSVMHGVRIRFFYVTGAEKKLVSLCEYMDVGDNNAVACINGILKAMKEWIVVEKNSESELHRLLSRSNSSSPPAQGVSRSSPSYGRDLDLPHTRDQSPRTPIRAISGVPGSTILPIHGSSPPAAHKVSSDIGRLGYSPASHSKGRPNLPDPYSQPVPGSSRQPSPAMQHMRPASQSPPDRRVSPAPSRHRSPRIVPVKSARAYVATASVYKWSNDHDSTIFRVQSRDNVFQSFNICGSDWRQAQIEDPTGRISAGFMVVDPSGNQVYTYSIDPETVSLIGGGSRPAWVRAAAWYKS